MTSTDRPRSWCIVGPTHPFRGGIARHTTLLADAASDAGFEVRLVSFRRQYPGRLYKGESDQDPDQIQPRSVVAERLLDGIGPRTWWTTATSIAATAPDVLVVVWWHPFFAPLLALLVRRVRRRSPHTVCIALCHNVLPHEGTFLDRSLVRLALGTQDGIVVHSDSEGRVAREVLGEVPVATSPHPTYQTESLPASPEPGAPDRAGRDADGTVNLLVFGLVRAYKGVDVLLSALPAVLERRDVRVVIAGEFWDPIEPYEDLIRDLDLGDHVELRPGYVPENELGALLAEADLMVASYRTATQSGAVEMALGAGVPVVASDVGGLGDQIQHGVDGLLVPAEDVAALSDAIVEATDEAMLGRLRTGATDRAPARTWSQLAADIDAFTSEIRPGT